MFSRENCFQIDIDAENSCLIETRSFQLQKRNSELKNFENIVIKRDLYDSLVLLINQ